MYQTLNIRVKNILLLDRRLFIQFQFTSTARGPNWNESKYQTTYTMPDMAACCLMSEYLSANSFVQNKNAFNSYNAFMRVGFVPVFPFVPLCWLVVRIAFAPKWASFILNDEYIHISYIHTLAGILVIPRQKVLLQADKSVYE